MKCESVQIWLLQCETLQPRAWPRKVGRHVKECASCFTLAKSLKKLENAWRKQPLPTQAAQPHPKFLEKIGSLETPARSGVKWGRPLRWLAAVAAVVVVGVGVAAWLIVSPAEVRASDFVDGLIEWNAQMCNADLAKRKQLLAENEDIFRKRLQNSRISKEERAMAELLLAAGRDLADSDDLEDDEVIITELADKLRVRAQNAEITGDKREADRLGQRHSKFVAQAVNPLQTKLRFIDSLIEWNMEIANADAKKRKQIFEDNEPAFVEGLKYAKLPPDEHAMAEKLIEVGRRLAVNSDPVKQAEAVTEAANKLLVRAETAEKKGKKGSERYGSGYSMFIEKAVNPLFERLNKSMQAKMPPGSEKKGGFDFAKQKKELERILQHAPQFSRPDMHKKFEHNSKKGFGWPPRGPGFSGYKK